MSIVTPTGYGMRGCVPPTADDRLQAYAQRLGGHYEPQGHARRAAEGLALLTRLRKLWRRLDAIQRRATKPKAAKPKHTNVVPIRRRA